MGWGMAMGQGLWGRVGDGLWGSGEDVGQPEICGIRVGDGPWGSGLVMGQLGKLRDKGWR